tara:strand:- start:241 stop:507 length:267 start_codon:yes stop_codon:yes gene_type:complete
MNKDEVLAKLKAGNVAIEFVKVSGQMRRMDATLNEDSIVYTPSDSDNARKSTNSSNVAVWDIEANGWRSFRWENLRLVDGNDLPNGIS